MTSADEALPRKPLSPLIADGDYTSAAYFLYIDNFGSVTTSSTLADQNLAAMGKELAKRGVVYTNDPPGHNELIGFTLDREGKSWVPTDRKLSRVDKALQYLLSPGIRVTGTELERLGGHLIHIFGLRCELYCTMHAFYRFIQHSYRRRQPLWPSVRKGLL